MARTLVTSWLAICFAANISVITLQLARVTLEWAFAAVGQLVCHRCGKVSIRIFDLRKVVQGQRVQFLHSMAKISKSTNVHFFTFLIFAKI